jgi:hypothetical protein
MLLSICYHPYIALLDVLELHNHCTLARTTSYPRKKSTTSYPRKKSIHCLNSNYVMGQPPYADAIFVHDINELNSIR